MLRTGDNIAVANTFSHRRYLLPYVELGKRYGYRVSILKSEENHGSIHSVPEEVRVRGALPAADRQLATFEPLETDSMQALEIHLHEAIKKGVATPEQLHELINRLTAGRTTRSSPVPEGTSPSVTSAMPDAGSGIASSHAKRGTGKFLEGKTNDERISESIELVSEAVAELQAQGRWHQNQMKSDRPCQKYES